MKVCEPETCDGCLETFHHDDMTHDPDDDLISYCRDCWRIKIEEAVED